MRASNSARPLRSPFRPGGIAHPLDREDITLSLVELEPLEDDDSLDLLRTLQLPHTRSDVALLDLEESADFSLEELSIIDDDDDDVVASCARLSQLCPAPYDDEELEIEVDEDIWVDMSELTAVSSVVDAPRSLVSSGEPNPFLVEEPSTFAHAPPVLLAVEAEAEDLSEWLEPLEEGEPESHPSNTLDPPTEDINWLLDPGNTLDPPTEDIDWLLEDEPSQTLEVLPLRRAPRRSMHEEKTLVLRRSWICMPPENTNASIEEQASLDLNQLLRIVRARARESNPRWRMPSLPRFPLLPPDPRVNPVHIPALRLPRFNVD